MLLLEIIYQFYVRQQRALNLFGDRMVLALKMQIKGNIPWKFDQ